ncbi:winged helix-turn-helix domain-containing protein [Geothrix mesophila]|uniref:winged helix-turn-helix domain-containing protein n=1 Tax=Geothrix mesophila TaxID=2922723 RepID=UPI001FACCE58|nr:winged helix-turn-helix domain-containing protein [Geothrix sp. SG198]
MTRLAFGGFELDPHTGELWKGEDCIRIQDQPLKLLLCLLERPGQIVGREELQKRVWSGDIHVGFEDGLNAAAWRLRQVLGDSAEAPAFIETIPRKGYRFVGKVVPLPGKSPPPSGSFPMPVFRPPSSSGMDAFTPTRVRRPWRPWTLWFGAVLGLGLMGVGVMLWGVMRARAVTLVITPLSNLTGDPAVDYFASALSRQVTQDLVNVPSLDVQSAERPDSDRSLPKAALTLTWTLDREAGGYRIHVNLRDAQGRSRGDRTFPVPQEELHRIHRTIADYIAQQVAGQAAGQVAGPATGEGVAAGLRLAGWAGRAGGGS